MKRRRYFLVCLEIDTSKADRLTQADDKGLAQGIGCGIARHMMHAEDGDHDGVRGFTVEPWNNRDKWKNI